MSLFKKEYSKKDSKHLNLACMDCSLDNSISSLGTVSVDTENSFIGVRLGTNFYFLGPTNEVYIYNRALSDEEIKQLYYNGLNNKFNVSFTMLYTGVQAENIGKDFTANIILSNGTLLEEIMKSL